MNVDAFAERAGPVLVAQLGARRHYAVPIAFHRKGRLGRFCTDFYLKPGPVRLAADTITSLLPSRALGRMKGRRGADLPPEYVTSFPIFCLRKKMGTWRATKRGARTAALMLGNRRFCELTARFLDDSFGAVYAFSSAAKELFEHARPLGVRAVLDHASAPRTFEQRLVQEERERFPGWAARDEPEALIAEFQERQIEELALADVVLCGSSFVRDAILAEGCAPGKLRVVPLGIHDQFFSISRRNPRRQGRLRVLFVGDDGLRKGVGYFASAAKLLGCSVEAKAVGALLLSKLGLATVAETVLVEGPVPRSRIGTVFAWADVLVLPSISDTFGLVVLEAMASGLPVIATPHSCGPDVIRDGVDGFIVPPRDATGIARRVEQLVADHDLLCHMAGNAQMRAREFTLSRYADRLIEALG